MNCIIHYPIFSPNLQAFIQNAKINYCPNTRKCCDIFWSNYLTADIPRLDIVLLHKFYPFLLTSYRYLSSQRLQGKSCGSFKDNVEIEKLELCEFLARLAGEIWTMAYVFQVSQCTIEEWHLIIRALTFSGDVAESELSLFDQSDASRGVELCFKPEMDSLSSSVTLKVYYELEGYQQFTYLISIIGKLDD